MDEGTHILPDATRWTERLPELRGLILNQIPARLRRHVPADDVMQEVWMRAASAATRPQNEREWLCRIGRAVVIDALRVIRSQRRSGRGRLRELCWREELERQRSRIRTPSGEFHRKETGALISLGLETLGRDHERAFRLHFVYDMSLSEVARFMGRSRASVSGLIYHARQELRRWLGPPSHYY